MRKAFAGYFAVLGLSAFAADWTGTQAAQPDEKILSAANVRKLQLLWKYNTGGRLTSPIILGRWVTNRGTKELLFIGSGRDVYAIDSDLGRLFWKRTLDRDVQCLTLAPGPGGPVDEDDDDIPQPLRPVFAHVKGGAVHALHPTTGADVAEPEKAGCPLPVTSARANGVEYRLTHDRLLASGAVVGRTSSAISTGLAIANGHVCFGTADGTVYCFGFPVDP